MHRHRDCVYRAELDMETLVWTRGSGSATTDKRDLGTGAYIYNSWGMAGADQREQLAGGVSRVLRHTVNAMGCGALRRTCV